MRAARSFLPAFLSRKFQLEIHIFSACIIQQHHGVIGLSRLFAVKPGHGNAALFQKGRRHGFCYGFLLSGKEFIVFPQRKGTVPVITKESFFAFIYGSAAAGAGADSLTSVSFCIREQTGKTFLRGGMFLYQRPAQIRNLFHKGLCGQLAAFYLL